MSPNPISIYENFNVWYYQIPLFMGLATIIWLLLKLWRHTREQQISVLPAKWNGGIYSHQWSLIQCLTHQATCCLCRSLIVDAMYCDSCGVCLDFNCYKNLTKFRYFNVLNRSLKNKLIEPLKYCKLVSISKKDSQQLQQSSQIEWKHHWVHGNIPSHSKCFICFNDCEEDIIYDDMNESVSSSTKTTINRHNDSMLAPVLAAGHTLYHYRCCWCQRTVHEDCFDKNQRKSSINGCCDFGDYRQYIIPPYCVIHRRVWTTTSRSKAIALDEIKDFSQIGPEPNWSPLLVIANRKSGNNDAGKILSKFLKILNPLQVIDLSDNDKSKQLELSLQMCKMLPEHVQVRILIAGGDGTIGWVLNTIHQLKLNPIPLVAIFPLGTGNDLARVLGWSKIFDSANCLTIDEIITAIYDQAKSIDFDRWSIEIKPIDYYHRSYNLLIESLRIPRSIMPLGHRSVFMYNYFSIGVDALVALNFHQTRKTKLYEFLFSNTFINKFLYFTYGTKDLWERRCKNVHTKVRLEIDSQPIELPELESIVVLNISSWGGGVKMVQKNHFDDQKLEILGLTSTFHIGQVMMGLSKPIFLGQGEKVKFFLDEHLPVQVDGEPWLQSPAQIEIKWNSNTKLLQYNPTK